MTFYGGGELTGAEYEGGSLLLMPTLQYDDWQMLDQQTIKALIATLRVAASIKVDRRLPFLSQTAAAILAQVQRLQIETAEAGLSTLPRGEAPERLTRRLKAFPAFLRGQHHYTPVPGQPSIWELYGYDQAVFNEILAAAEGVAGTLRHLPDIDFNTQLAEKLFQEFERLELGDFCEAPTPDPTQGPVVDFGCDLKLLLTWLSFAGPVLCEIGADDRFRALLGEGRAAPPADAVTAVVPTPGEELPHEEYVVVVAVRARGKLQELMKREPLHRIVARLEREHGSFDAEYLLRRVDEEGNLIQRWGDGGYAWMAHEDFRRSFSHGRATVPPNVFELPGPVNVRAAG